MVIIAYGRRGDPSSPIRNAAVIAEIRLSIIFKGLNIFKIDII